MNKEIEKIISEADQFKDLDDRMYYAFCLHDACSNLEWSSDLPSRIRQLEHLGLGDMGATVPEGFYMHEVGDDNLARLIAILVAEYKVRKGIQ